MGQAESISLLFSTHGSSPDILVVVKIYEGGGTPFGAPSWLFSGGGSPSGVGLVVVVFLGVGVLEGSYRSDNTPSRSDQPLQIAQVRPGLSPPLSFPSAPFARPFPRS